MHGLFERAREHPYATSAVILALGVGIILLHWWITWQPPLPAGMWIEDYDELNRNNITDAIWWTGLMMTALGVLWLVIYGVIPTGKNTLRTKA